MTPWDAIDLAIAWSRLAGILDASAVTLVRTSFSTIVREAHDYALLLLDERGDVVAENSYGLVAFVNTMPIVMKNFLSRWPIDDWAPGDVAVTNDPWLGLGHILDLGMATPLQLGGRTVGFIGSIAHVPDIGGLVWGADARDVFEEGLRVPVSKIYQAGQRNEAAFALVGSNTRLPDQFFGDLEARRVAHEKAAQWVSDFLTEYGLSSVGDFAPAMYDYSESAMREAIGGVPDGVYRSSIQMDGIDQPLEIRAAITISGTSVEVDYADTSSQVQAGINLSPAECFALTVYPLKCILDPDTPRTSGSYRPFSVSAPLGSILNPRFPAAMNARQVTGHFIHAVIMQALADVLPDRVIAPCGTPHMQVVFSGRRVDGTYFTALPFDHPGMGAHSTQDGLHSTHFPGNAGSTSIEVIEHNAPLLIHTRTLACDSGGAGRFRGGCGIDVEIQNVASEPILASVLGDRVHHPAPGILGGQSGLPALIVGPDGEALPAKSRFLLPPGGSVRYREAGGGGFGPPNERDPRAVRTDLMNGLISEAAALAVYRSGDRT